jgi:hypothetical protein
MMEQAWCISEESDAAIAPKVNSFLQRLHSGLIVLIGGPDKVSDGTIQKLFNDHQNKVTKGITVDILTNMMAKCKISVERKYMQSIFRAIDVDHSGVITIDEFAAFIKQ